MFVRLHGLLMMVVVMYCRFNRVWRDRRRVGVQAVPVKSGGGGDREDFLSVQ